MSSENLNTNDSETELLQQWCVDGTMPECTKELAQPNVGMNKDGSVVYFRIDNRRTALKQHRKNLVLGLDGYSQHSLAEANQIISGAAGIPSSGLSEYILNRA